MKMKWFSVMLLMFPFLVQATEQNYLSEFATRAETSKIYRELIGKQPLPEWVKGGGTSTPAREIKINDISYLMMSGCKPHACPLESIAVLYSPSKGDIHGVYSAYDPVSHQQKLIWLNLDPVGSDYMRDILFTHLSGGE